MNALENIKTDRLFLHRPRREDAVEILEGYASNKIVTKYVGFRCHETIRDTYEFLSFSDSHWKQWSVGPYSIRLREDNSLIGSTGLTFDTKHRAMTGYILAVDSWGKGYATEVLKKMLEIGQRIELKRIYAICHTEHQNSWRVLEKCGFVREGILRSYTEFPNLIPGKLYDVYCYSFIL